MAGAEYKVGMRGCSERPGWGAGAALFRFLNFLSAPERRKQVPHSPEVRRLIKMF